MAYKQLYIFVEGPDDDRFFDRILKPPLEKEHDLVKIVNYATETPIWLRNYIKNVQSMKTQYRTSDYVLVADANSAPCVTARKRKIKNKYGSRVIDEGRVAVVGAEIESWYLAGLSASHSKSLGIANFTNTDQITKEQFNDLIPARSIRTNFMIEILNKFSLKIAKRKNSSFNHFVEKHL